MVDGVPSAEEAGAWLREHCADDPEGVITASWKVAKHSDAVHRRLLEILFGPRPGDRAA